MDKLIITTMVPFGGGKWISAQAEDEDGMVLGSETAPLVEGSTFDFRKAVIRECVEQALRGMDDDSGL